MTKTELKTIKQIASELNISVTEYENDIDFEYYTTYNQDFCFTIQKAETLNDFADDVYDYWQNYNADEEASLWIGEDGHGKNGAPYHISDILKDMQECEDLLKKFWTMLYNVSENKISVANDVEAYMQDFVSSQYGQTINEFKIESDETFLDKVVEDVLASSNVRTDGKYNDDDIKFAIGRTILDLLSK